MTSETSLRGFENGFVRPVSEGCKNGLVRLVLEEVENGKELNFQTYSQRGQKLTSETSLRGLERGFARLVSEW